MFYEQLYIICQQKGTTPTGLLRKLGLSPSKATAWKNGSIPKQKTLQMLADELGVTTEAFFADEKDDGLSDDEKELLEAFRKLDRSKQRQLLGKAYELQDAQESKSDAAIAPPNVDLAALGVRDRQIKK